jgi:hypothetical protein
MTRKEAMKNNENIHVGADFECNQTEGFPTFLYYDPTNKTAWLMLSEGTVDGHIHDGQQDIVDHCENLCDEWGVRSCVSWDDYEILIKDLGAKYYDDMNEGEDQDTTISIHDLYTSQDFQCDQTSGYPTVLVWNQDDGVAILQPAPAFDDDSEDAKQCIRECAEWGIHSCTSWEDFNGLLESIGEDAVRNAYVPDDEDEEFGGMTLQ